MFTDQPLRREREGNFRRARVLGVLEKLVNEVRAVGIKILENIEVDLPLVGVEAVDELASALHQPLKFGTVLPARHLTPPHATANFATRPSSVALPMI